MPDIILPTPLVALLPCAFVAQAGSSLTQSFTQGLPISRSCLLRIGTDVRALFMFALFKFRQSWFDWFDSFPLLACFPLCCLALRHH